MAGVRVRVCCDYALGDNVVLTAAIRDLQLAYPGNFQTTIRTKVPAVWEYNPYLSRNASAEVEIDCSQVRLDKQGLNGRHYVQAYLDLLNESLGTNAPLTRIEGDIHVSSEERRWYSDLWSLCGDEIPFWLISSGGKFDISVKWWDSKRYQEVVRALRGKIQFVQVGAWGDYHPYLEGAIDLRGKTKIRDLIHLVYHADGVLCGVTGLMHLAAAVPKNTVDRASVIVAGAREPRCWEAYPGHEFIWSGERVPCSQCWKDSHDPRLARPENRCGNVSNGLPACMDQISSEEVIESFSRLQSAGRIRFLENRHHSFAAVALEKAKTSFDQHNITPFNSVAKADEFLRELRRYPSKRFAGRGIVICAGGVDYFAQAWVCIKMLRQHGCKLPVEIWHYGRAELDRRMEDLLRTLGVKCVNARETMNRYPMRNPLGYELKCYALLHSRFREVLLLDADNVALCDPEFLFQTDQFKATGAIFWPDYGRLSARRSIWKFCGVPYRSEPEFESGQIIVDKERCWRPLNLAWWYNDHSEFFYKHIHGDKDTFHLAWRRIGQPYSMPPFPIFSLEGVMCQHDFTGRRIFQHRNSHKWSFFGENRRIPGFEVEEDCLAHLNELRALWDGRIDGKRATTRRFDFTFRKGTSDLGIFESVVLGNEYYLPERLAPDDAVVDIGAHIGSFARICFERGSRSIFAFEPHPESYRLARGNLKAHEGVRIRQAAILHEANRVNSSPFPREIGRENTGGSTVIVHSQGRTKALAMDAILRKVGSVALVKLDCEGSEWPILLHSREWGRTKAVCGEYHAMPSHSLCAEIEEPLSERLLRTLLLRHFKYVKTIPDKGAHTGKFWASNVRDAFARVFA